MPSAVASVSAAHSVPYLETRAKTRGLNSLSAGHATSETVPVKPLSTLQNSSYMDSSSPNSELVQLLRGSNIKPSQKPFSQYQDGRGRERVPMEVDSPAQILNATPDELQMRELALATTLKPTSIPPPPSSAAPQPSIKEIKESIQAARSQAGNNCIVLLSIRSGFVYCSWCIFSRQEYQCGKKQLSRPNRQRAVSRASSKHPHFFGAEAARLNQEWLRALTFINTVAEL